MAEATTAIDPAAENLSADPSTAVARPATGLTAILQRLTGGQSIRQSCLLQGRSLFPLSAWHSL